MKKPLCRTIVLSGDAFGETAARAVSDSADGVIVFPTDTFYGLGTRPASAAGAAKIYRLKGRASTEPLLLLVDDPLRVQELASGVTETHRRLMERFWPGPLTILFDARPGLPEPVVSARGEVAVRLPGSVLCRKIVAAAGGVLTGTSANLSGEGPALSTAGIASSVIAGADLVLDAGTLPPAHVSTVLSLAGGRIAALREGAVKMHQIVEFLDIERG